MTEFNLAAILYLLPLVFSATCSSITIHMLPDISAMLNTKDVKNLLRTFLHTSVSQSTGLARYSTSPETHGLTTGVVVF